MHCSFKIHISQQFTIKCSIITPDEQETPITIQENKEEYPICLEFTNKDIIICQENAKAPQCLKSAPSLPAPSQIHKLHE